MPAEDRLLLANIIEIMKDCVPTDAETEALNVMKRALRKRFGSEAVDSGSSVQTERVDQIQ